MSAPPNTINALFIFLKTKTATKLAMAITMVRQSVSVSFVISMQTAMINATAATLTASKIAPMIFDFRILGINGFNSSTKRKEGRKMPIVAASAPAIPFICQPMKVAVDKTGPGVICPTATASIKACLVNQPFATNSVSRKANKT